MKEHNNARTRRNQERDRAIKFRYKTKFRQKEAIEYIQAGKSLNPETEDIDAIMLQVARENNNALFHELIKYYASSKDYLVIIDYGRDTIQVNRVMEGVRLSQDNKTGAWVAEVRNELLTAFKQPLNGKKTDSSRARACDLVK
jgi:hypothetical protein